MIAATPARPARLQIAALASAIAALGGCADDAPPAPQVRIVAPADQLIRTTIQTWTGPESATPVIGPAWVVIRPIAAADPVTIVAATPAPAADRAATATVDLLEGDYTVDVRVWDTPVVAPIGPSDHAALDITAPILRAWVPSFSLSRSSGDQAALALVAATLDTPGAVDGLARPLVMPVEAAGPVTEGQPVMLRTFVFDDRDPRPNSLAGHWSDDCAPTGSSFQTTAVTIAANAFGSDGKARLLVRWTPARAGPCTVAFEVRDATRGHRNATRFQVTAP